MGTANNIDVLAAAEVMERGEKKFYLTEACNLLAEDVKEKKHQTMIKNWIE